MKRILPVLLCLSMPVAAFSAASISNVSVHQLWPWSNAVRVGFTLSGITEPVDVTAAFSSKGAAIDIPEKAIHGQRYCLAADGDYCFTIDAVKAFGASRTVVADFAADLTISPSSALHKEVLYRALKLSDNTWMDISRGQLLNGDFGSVETDFGAIGEGYNTTLQDVCIWTGVTNDTKWATEYVVLRKIPKGKFDFAPLFITTHFPSADNLSELTYDYWVGVFPMTQAQFEDVYVKGNPDVKPWCGNDGSDHYYEYGNIYTNAVAPVTCLGPYMVGNDWCEYGRDKIQYASEKCFFGRLYARTGLKFRLPTNLEWARAERAGAPRTSYYYDGISTFKFAGYDALQWADGSAFSSDNRYGNVLGRHSGNGGEDGPAPVGSYRPNAFGLYDMVGNIGELADDEYRTDKADAPGYIAGDTVKNVGLKDFIGASNGSSYQVTLFGCWYGGSGLNMNGLGGNRIVQTHNKKVREPRVGLRLCIADADFTVNAN